MNEKKTSKGLIKVESYRVCKEFDLYLRSDRKPLRQNNEIKH